MFSCSRIGPKALLLGRRAANLVGDLARECLFLLIEGVEYRDVDVLTAASDLIGRDGQQGLVLLYLLPLLDIDRADGARLRANTLGYPTRGPNSQALFPYAHIARKTGRR